MPLIRLMSSSDCGTIVELEKLVFTEYYRRTGRNNFLSSRTTQNILACLDLNPQGCFIAINEKPEPVGFIFSRFWGKTGWIGTFGVHPDTQGQGIGKALLSSAVESLKKSGCAAIGLETMPDSPYNVGFYTRFGFRLTFPTLTLSKKTSLPVQNFSFATLSRPPKPETLAEVRQISQSVQLGLDYTSEADNAIKHKWGEVLFCGYPQTWAMVIIRTTPKREETQESACEISALAVHPDWRDRFIEILQAIEMFAPSRNFSSVILPVNAIDWFALQTALTYGFRVKYVALRMILGDYPPSKGMDLSKWSM